MLSRTAESLFWIGRHLERADGTARILDVYLQLLVEDPWIDENDACRSLLAVMGSEVPDDLSVTRGDVLSMLAVDRHNPVSIAYSLGAAREHARRAREIVSTELWECLNTTRARMPRKVSGDKVHEFFGWVKERSALAVGIVESATSRDEVWQFFTLGRSVERVDMTARLLSTHTLTEASGPTWTTLLRSVGAYEAFARTYRGAPAARNAAEFLLLDRLFPRSVLFAVSRAEACLREVQPVVHGSGSEAGVRILAELRGRLEDRPITEILVDLPGAMAEVQSAIEAASEAIRSEHFPVPSTSTAASRPS